MYIKRRYMMDVLRKSQQDRIKDYLASHAELTPKTGDSSPVKIENRDEFKRRMISAVRGSVDAFLNSKRTLGQKLLKRDEQIDDELSESVLDESLQLKLRILKAHKPITENGKLGKSQLHLIIEKDGKSIAEFGLRDYGDEFRLSHRKTHPDYRKNGIANIAMESIEEFVKEYVKKVPGRKAVIETYCSQLDVVSWFMDNGFEEVDDKSSKRPDDTGFEIHDLETILTSLENEDGDYKVGPYLYVFPGKFKGPKIIHNDGPEGVNIDESATVHFRKKLEAGDSSDSSEIKGRCGKIAKSILRCLGR